MTSARLHLLIHTVGPYGRFDYDSNVDAIPLRLTGDGLSVGTIELPQQNTASLTVTSARALILTSARPFDVRLSSTDTWLTSVRAFGWWGDDDSNTGLTADIELRNPDDDGATIEALLVGDT